MDHGTRGLADTSGGGGDPKFECIAVVIVDHGSKRAESNEMLIRFVDQFRRVSTYDVVEPAHMELAEPSIATAFDRCVERGAQAVVVSPYFLLPGKHWHGDIPRLAGEAAAKHPGVRYLVTAPIGLHPLMIGVIQSRIDHCLAYAAGRAAKCDVCVAGQGCGFLPDQEGHRGQG